MNYPAVKGEFETVKEILTGKSIARFGDGELKIVYGSGYVRAEPNKELTAEIREVLRKPNPMCLVGIPTMDRDGAKYCNWERHIRRFSRVVSPNIKYYSAFISRPDSAPWINTAEYALLLCSVWANRRVVIVCETGNSLLHMVTRTAAHVEHIECPSREAYAHIDEYEKVVVKRAPDLAVLSLGPTATCLANRLAKRGVQGLDLGSAGGFLRKLLDPKKKGAAS